MLNAIEIRNLSKQYKSGFEIKKMDLEIKEGIITGFIGENGSGKTTLIKLILNILHYDQGQITIFAKDNIEYESEIKEDIGIVLDDMFFPETLNAKDLDGIMKNIYKTWDSDLYHDYLLRFNLPIKTSIKKLSKGMKKKLEIATALAHRPKLLILDEPTSGLDPVVRNEVLDIFLEFIQNEENSIFLSSHITSDLDRIADEIVLIDEGKILLKESKDEIIYNYGILKCDTGEIGKIDKKDILAKRKTKYFYEMLVNKKEEIKRKYPNCVMDDINLEELMVLLIKGEK